MTRPNTRKGRAPRIAAVVATWLPLRWREKARASAVHRLAGLQPVIVGTVGLTRFGDSLRLNEVTGSTNGAAAGIVSRWHSRTMGQPT